MTRPTVLLGSLAAATLLSAACSTLPTQGVEPAAPPRPNIIFFFTDDIGPGDLGAYNPDSMIPTENLDRLAAGGILFTQAYTPAAISAPTRYGVLTGNYPWRGRREFGTWQFSQSSQILPGQTTIADLLGDAGYQNAMFGKMHLGGDFHLRDGRGIINQVYPDWEVANHSDEVDWTRRFENGPLDFGFHYSFVLPSGIQDEPYAFFENDRMVGDPERMGHREFNSQESEGGIYQRAGQGLPYPDWDITTVGPRMTDKAIAFMERHFEENRRTGEQRPFFIHYCSESAHNPWFPPHFLDDCQVRGVTGGTWRMDKVFEADLLVGRMIETLESLGELDNTLFIFSSDNGGESLPEELTMGHDGVNGLRAKKSYIYEGGLRVPFIAHWPGTIPAGSVSDAVISVQDLYATFAEILGAGVAGGQAVDSISFAHLLRQPDARGHRERTVFSSSPHDDNRHALRDGDWKLILRYEDGFPPDELYHLASDPAEEENLIDDPRHRSRVGQMHSTFLEIRHSD